MPRFSPRSWLPALYIASFAFSAAAALDVSNASADVFTRDGVLDLVQRANAYTREHAYVESDNTWIRGTWYTGIMALYRASGDPRLLRQARAWSEKHAWQLPRRDSPPNVYTCVQTYAELYQLDPDPAMLAPAEAWTFSGSPTAPVPGKVWYLEGGRRYADSLYVAPPAFARLWQCTGDRRYLEIMDAMFWDVTAELFDPDYGLYYRDHRYRDAKTPGGRKVFWARGNGWVFAGIPRILDALPPDHPARARYLDVFRRMASALKDAQGADGLWRTNLADPEQYPGPETSGTAFFTFGMAWGIDHGVLDSTAYLPAVQRAWRGLAAAVSPEGKLGWVQPVGADPRLAGPDSTHEYAVGALLLAGAELLALAGRYDLAATGTALLPPKALYHPFLPVDHPLAAEINTFLERQSRWRKWKRTRLTRDDYLEVVAGQVAVAATWQDAQGRIIDPVEKIEKYYSTPCFAHSVATLAAAGRAAPSLLECGMRAMDAAVSAMSTGNGAEGHGDFYTWPLMLALREWNGVAPQAHMQQWREGLSRIDPARYRSGPTGNNWNLVHVSGEFLRHQEGFVDLKYVERCLSAQRKNFTALGMYVDPGQPPAYDVFSRHYVGGMLRLGYRGDSYFPYRDLLWKGAWSSLFLQSPFGELPTGYRSSQHIWNEAELAVVFELYASAYAEAGRSAEAGAFKRAAHLALASVKSWIRRDGTGYVVKNRYPIAVRHGYERYTSHACYNMLACSMRAQAWRHADESIDERPAPADVGGFVVQVEDFHKIIATAGGAYLEYDTRGDQTYNPTGLLRVHIRGGNAVLGPSDGCAPRLGGGPASLAVGPAWPDGKGGWRRLAKLASVHPRLHVEETTPERVRFQVVYDHLEAAGRPLSATESYRLEPDGVTVEDALSGGSAGGMRLYYPALVFDGERETRVRLRRNTLKLDLRGRGMQFTVKEPRGVNLQRNPQRIDHRNGQVEEIFAEVAGNRVVYRIAPR